MLDVLRELLQNHGQEGGSCEEEILQRLAENPLGFRICAFELVRQGVESSRASYLLRLLHEKGLLLDALVSPSALTLEDADRIANIARRDIPNFARMVARTVRNGSVDEIARALDVLQRIPVSQSLLPLLKIGLRHENPKVRSRASKLWGKVRKNVLSSGTIFEDADPRVRANLIEALWQSEHPSVKPALEVALQDRNGRVAANAALGLYKLGEEKAATALEKLASLDSEPHRCSAAWGMGETKDVRFLPSLKNLARDPSAAVREISTAAMIKISALERPQVKLHSAHESAEGKIRLLASVAGP